MLISKELFTGELYIEGLGGQSTTATLIGRQLDMIIERREPEYLREFLGCLYEPFMEYLNGDIDEQSPYYKLYEYLCSNNSPIAYYVYFYYIRYVNSSVTANGVRKDRVNAHNPSEKLVFAWDTMVDINKRINEYLHKEFPEYRPNKYLLMYTNSML